MVCKSLADAPPHGTVVRWRRTRGRRPRCGGRSCSRISGGIPSRSWLSVAACTRQASDIGLTWRPSPVCGAGPTSCSRASVSPSSSTGATGTVAQSTARRGSAPTRTTGYRRSRRTELGISTPQPGSKLLAGTCCGSGRMPTPALWQVRSPWRWRADAQVEGCPSRRHDGARLTPLVQLDAVRSHT